MNTAEIARLRLNSQQIAGTQLKTVREIVSWMGAMQAQDFAMARWAAGIRLPGSTEEAVTAAIDAGEVLRTHVLRPTWHFVSADDIYWMLELTAPHIKASMKSRHRQLGLSEAAAAKSNRIIEGALARAKYLTREELIPELKKGGFEASENRMSHLLAAAELDGVVCSGPQKGGKPTYALLEERVPKPQPLAREEALTALAKRYFASRGPATLQDFIWWSGLPIGSAKLALELAKPHLASETVASQAYWFAAPASMPAAATETAYLLPAFDEFIIGYRDRSASLPFEGHKKTVSQNGIFWPVVVIDGQVMGIWKRTVKKDKVIVEAQFFQSPDEATAGLLEKAAARYGHFLGKKAVL